jgi:HAD superfamily hydrolase (TIGR01549 family)
VCAPIGLGTADNLPDTVIFDVDGTLVDSNYQHALAWFRAFRRFDITRPLWRIHRGLGMGGDNFVPEIGGADVEAQHGDALRDAWAEEFAPMIDEIRPFDGAHQLLREVKRRGLRLVLASSGQREHVEKFLDLIDGKSLADAWTTSDDAEHTKPAPDLIVTALRKVEGADGIMVGDSPYDVIAAQKVSVSTIALRTGGFSPEELTDAGATAVYDSLVDLRENLDVALRA